MAIGTRSRPAPASDIEEEEESSITVTNKSFYGSTSSPSTPRKRSTPSKTTASASTEMSTRKRRCAANIAATSSPTKSRKTTTKANAQPQQLVASSSRATPITPTKRGVPIYVAKDGPPSKKPKLDTRAREAESESEDELAAAPASSVVVPSSEDEEEVVVVRKGKGKSTPQKTPTRLQLNTPPTTIAKKAPVTVTQHRVASKAPSSSNSNSGSGSDDDDDEVQQQLSPSSPHLPSTLSKPYNLATSSAPTTPSRSSSARANSPSPPPPRRPTPMLVDSEDSEDSADESSDELDCLSPARKVSAPAKIKLTPLNELKGIPLAGPLRSSERARGLPTSRKIMDSAPRILRNNLVGCHPDSESEDEEEEEEEVRPPTSSPLKGKGKQVLRRRSGDSSSSERRTFSTPLFQSMLGSIGSVLTGHQLPAGIESGKEEWDKEDVMAHPYVLGYEEWERPMRFAMESVVKDGTGNCLVVLGPRGVGKTMIVEKSLALLTKVRGPDAFITVRLNGLVHTTDRQALRAIGRQLKSSGFSEDEGDWGSNAATMATLLRMLEPNDLSKTKEKPVIMIVDEFDLFALHPRQSFLYCLLDIVQGNRRKGGMGVIGLSSRTDCLSILEKRVRSRCQSQVHQMVLPNSLDDYIERVESLLKAQIAAADENTEMGELAGEWNDEVESFVADREVKKYFEKLWRVHGNTPTHLLKVLASMYYTIEWNARQTASSSLNQMAIPRLSVNLLPTLPSAGGKRDDLLSRSSLHLPLHDYELIGTCNPAELTVLELTVCVAAKHVRAVGHDACNLEMLFDCYKDHLRGKGAVGAKKHSKTAFGMALDSLREKEVFLPATGKPAHYFVPSLADGFKMLRFVPWTAMLDAELQRRGDIPEPVKRWNNNGMSG